MSRTIGILYIGDIIGKPGRGAVKRLLSGLLKRYGAEFVVANGENSAAGFGITRDVFDELIFYGVNVVTSGNHIWDKKEVLDFIDDKPMLLRPANYPPAAPGSGSTIFECDSGIKVGVLNLAGRVFMDAIDCPFRAAEAIVKNLRGKTPVIFVDIHAEATSEKAALAWHLDGMASAVIGSHTHVQTSDERILPKGTAFITDAGMTGATDSVIGVEKELVLKRFLTGMPVRFEVAENGVEFQGVYVEVDTETGKAIKIERIKERVG